MKLSSNFWRDRIHTSQIHQHGRQFFLNNFLCHYIYLRISRISFVFTYLYLRSIKIQSLGLSFQLTLKEDLLWIRIHEKRTDSLYEKLSKKKQQSVNTESTDSR